MRSLPQPRHWPMAAAGSTGSPRESSFETTVKVDESLTQDSPRERPACLIGPFGSIVRGLEDVDEIFGVHWLYPRRLGVKPLAEQVSAHQHPDTSSGCLVNGDRRESSENNDV